jgi:hypothetical protein
LQDLHNRLGILDDLLGIFRRNKTNAKNFGRLGSSAAANEEQEKNHQQELSARAVHLCSATFTESALIALAFAPWPLCFAI